MWMSDTGAVNVLGVRVAARRVYRAIRAGSQRADNVFDGDDVCVVEDQTCAPARGWVALGVAPGNLDSRGDVGANNAQRYPVPSPSERSVTGVPVNSVSPTRSRAAATFRAAMLNSPLTRRDEERNHANCG